MNGEKLILLDRIVFECEVCLESAPLFGAIRTRGTQELGLLATLVALMSMQMLLALVQLATATGKSHISSSGYQQVYTQIQPQLNELYHFSILD